MIQFISDYSKMTCCEVEYLEDSEILAILEMDSDSDLAYDSDEDPEFIPEELLCKTE